MELELGMYVRFKDKRGSTYIRKLVKLANEYPQKLYGMEIDIEANYSEYLGLKNVLKASHNIIDLIQVGDYVNGCYVSNKRASVNEHLGGYPKGIGIIKCNAYFNQGNYNDCKFEWIEEKDIKSIVTKEQFESMKYEVKEE